MRAITLRSYGTYEHLRLEEVERPEPAAGEVRIAVRSSAVNPADWLVMPGPLFLRASSGLRRPKHPIPGMDVAGVVDAVGPGVTGLAVGDAVYGELARGAFAEYVCTTPDVIARMPGNLDFDQAAAMPLAGLAALHGVRDVGEVKQGDRVLVIGAAGGVGTFAVQIAKALGAEVTGVCSSASAEMVRTIGADRVIDYTKDDIAATDERFDLILDNAATHPLKALRRLLTPTGVLVPNSANGGLRRMLAAVLLGKVARQPIRIYLSRSSTADLDALRGFAEAGEVTPVIDRTYRLEETPEAFAYATQGHVHGKVVISVSDGGD